MLRSLKAGPLQRRKSRTLRIGRIQLYPLHFAHSPLSRPDCPSPFRRLARRQAQVLAPERLHLIADDCSDTERRAADAERELVEWKKAKFMEDRVGEEFPRADHQHHALWLLRRTGEPASSKAWCPSIRLPGDRYMFHENARKIVGQRTRREFSIGDTVTVLLDRVEPIERKLQFSLVEPERPRKKKRR